MTNQNTAIGLLPHYEAKGLAIRAGAPGVAPMAPQAPPPIVQGYATARLLATNRTEAVKAINRGLDHWLEEFQAKIDAMWDSMGWKKQTDWRLRLAAYEKKPTAIWQEQAAKFPRDYTEDWTDFQDLKIKADLEYEKGGAVAEAQRIVTRQPMLGGGG